MKVTEAEEMIRIRLSTVMRQNRITPSILARKTGISESVIRGYIQEGVVPTAGRLAVICEVLKLDISWVFGLKGDPYNPNYMIKSYCEWTLRELVEHCKSTDCADCDFCENPYEEDCGLCGRCPGNWNLDFCRWQKDDIKSAKAIKTILPGAVMLKRHTGEMGSTPYDENGRQYATEIPLTAIYLEEGETVILDDIIKRINL